MKLPCPDCRGDLVEFDPGSGNYHCTNPTCNFQYVEATSGKEHRRTITADTSIQGANNLGKKPKRILVGLAIESALISMGHSIFDRVTTKLRDDYGATVFDCLEKPKYLKAVLEGNFEKSVADVVSKSIRAILGEFAYYDSIRQFLEDLGDEGDSKHSGK